MLKSIRLYTAGLATLLLATAAQSVPAEADVAERCSGPQTGVSGTYRTCIYATVDVVRARTYILTRACDFPTGCVYQAQPRLYVELYLGGARVNADAVTYPVGVSGRFEVVAYYKNDRRSNDRYWSTGRASSGSTVSTFPGIIV
jgi:hypothetical protein